MSEKQNEKRGLRWWINVVIAVLSAIAGALTGMNVIAPALTNNIL